ncbi:conserved hypothetical protein [Talaromyces stipitatus ATCC 10500]|uniref:Flo11 n=1 Tax=Talaromyces stipitatus (strain ATCC 10500 / CBS 375.48 / QM 6759 / NRRL 1006) TaxID=441959 RepID=B8MBI5_TALSN|nr:uncharacterized protein TSTA_116390 [Talaromyces stipitatus ATCC 10500]EED17849.1 conserved hypothetical protein [Talaromyces stipitatus ATCC 10500]
MRNQQDIGDMSPLTRSRSVSVSSDATPKAMLSSPPPVDPSPAFIAPSSAAQIISVDMEQNEVMVSDEEGCINSNSLALLNGFLDYLLFSFLASAKSTQLSALRPAIADVLKPRLAREVVAAADEELGEYMGGGDEDELQEFRGGRAPHGEFDLVRAWKLARLRCMVYTRLGDLEEEEEDEYIVREGLDESGGAPRRFSGHAGNITPAAAIFLTSIIEYIGEHALVIAGENARNRVFSAARLASKLANPEGANQKMTVEESDMEKLALNSTLGRLWRTWKKGIRSSPILARSFSRESFARRSTTPSSKSAFAITDDIYGRDSRVDEHAEEKESRRRSIEPASIALPMNEKDVDEIEVPGLWVGEEEAETMQAAIAQKVRPRSLIVSRCSGPPTPTSPSRYPGTWPATNSPQHSRAQSVPVHIEIFKKADRSPVREAGLSLETVTENEGNETVLTTEAPTLEDRNVTSTSIPKKTEERSENELQPLATVSQTTSNEDIAHSMPGDAPGDEIVEGQGTYQRPKLNSLSMQRPKRKQSKDTTKKEGPDTYVVENRADYRDDHPSMQGGEMGRGVQSAPTQQNALHADDVSYAHESAQTILHPIAPTSHPRQLETDKQTTVEENINNLPRHSPNPSQQASSFYTESIGAPHSTSDDSEGSIHRSIPSRAASHAASVRSQPRQDDPSPGRERATVQRVYGPTTTSQASIRSRRSTSISEKRPLTSGSGASNVSSKLKVLIGRHPAEVDVPLPAPPRRSSDASRFAAGDDADEAALDELIKSDETIRFTLTPRTMREIEMPGSPRWNTARNDVHKDRTDTSDLATFFRTTAPPGEPVPAPRSTTEQEAPVICTKPAPSMIDSSRSHSAGGTVSEKSSPTSVHSTASPVSRTSSGSRAAMHQAREARVGGESVRDFAQFIRATGPRTEAGPSGHTRDGSESLVNSSRPETAQSISSRTTAKPRSSTNSAKRNGPRLQARDPAGHDSNKTSDLIDFIREGPPGASTHRIPRTVAPFRNTMDSDDLVLNETARDNDTRVTPSLASTGAESTSSSRAPLLSKSGPADAPPIPARKRRGPRDPYAIDVSDDEDEEQFSEPSIPSKPPRAEESLLDFLNSVPPPVTQKAPEPFILTSYPLPPNTPSGQTVSSVRNRFRRNTVTDKTPTSKKSMPSMRSPKTVTKPQISSPLPQSNGLPANRSGYSAQMTRERGLASQPSMPSLSRPARQTETGALADFLKNTGPPEPISRPPTIMSEDRKDSTFSKFFRRKRVEA